MLGAIGLALALVGALVDQIRRRRVISGGPPPDGPPSQPPSSGDTGTAVTATDEQNRGTGAAEAAPPVAPPGSAAISPDTPVPNEQAGASTGSAPSPAAVSPAIQPPGRRTSGLDADLTAWFSATTHRPKLTLLGPVHARTYGQALARRKPYYTELLAYLTLKPHGATVDEIADTFSLTTARVRTDMKVLRDWLGHDPTTGQPYLPDARNSPAALQRGIPTYEVQGVLCDYHLFTQLRARAHTATSESRISDLETALRLVSGEPFTRTRTNGWHWVFEGNRLDLQATTEIVSVTDIAADHHRNEHTSHQPASTRADSAKAS